MAETLYWLGILSFLAIARMISRIKITLSVNVHISTKRP